MKWISTTIKKKYLDKILSGEKKIEYKGATDYWIKRLKKHTDPNLPYHLAINFLCGKDSYKFCVTGVYEIRAGSAGAVRDIDGKWYNHWYEIYLGDRIE